MNYIQSCKKSTLQIFGKPPLLHGLFIHRKKGGKKKKLITSVFYFATDGHSVGMDFHTPSHETHSWHL
jgi:hypothetical protein